MLQKIAFILSLVMPSFFYSENPDSLRIEKNILNARELFGSNPKKGLEISYTALKASQKTNNPFLIAKSYNTIGSCLYYLGKGDSSVYYHEQALAIQNQIGDPDGAGRSSANIALYLMDNGNNKEAIRLFMNAEKSFQKTENKTALSKIYNNLGTLFYNIKDYKNSFEYYNNTLQIAQSLNDSLMLYTTLGNLGNVYHALKDNNKALEAYQKALQIALKIGNELDALSIINNVTGIYINANNNNEAIRLNNIARKIISRNNLENYQRISVYENYGNILINLNDFVKASLYADTAIKFADESGLTNRLPQLYELKARALLYADQNKEAAIYYNKTLELKDTLYARQLNSQLSEIKTKYEVSKKEEQLKRFETEKEYQTKVKWLLFSIIGIIALLLALLVFSYLRKVNDNKTIILQKKIVEEKNKLVEEKQKEIIDSITYAKRIQTLLMSGENDIRSALKEYFIYYKPKDIVSGDFYWASLSEDKLFVLIGDSTGHGVPGAFMSLLNLSYIQEAINEKKITDPNLIFDFVKQKLSEKLRDDDGMQARDGMDGILFQIQHQHIKIAAANNSPVIIRNGSLITVKADKMAVSFNEKTSSGFSLHEFTLEKGDAVYAFTDGYYDQFGGPDGKKLKQKNLLNILCSISHLPMEEQKNILHQKRIEWQGKHEQIDDILIFGFKY